MIRTASVVLCVLTLLALAATGASAQSEKKFGVGFDLENGSFSLATNMVFLADDGAFMPFFTVTDNARVNPALVFSLRASPKFFIEPAIGLQQLSMKTEHTPSGDMSEFSVQDLTLGLGLRFVTNPTGWASPFLGLKGSVHMLEATDEYSSFFGDPGTNKDEYSASATELTGSIGGIIKVHDQLFFTVEGQLFYGHVGDTEVSLTGPDADPGFVDDFDTSSSAFRTNMAVGVRVLMF